MRQIKIKHKEQNTQTTLGEENSVYEKLIRDTLNVDSVTEEKLIELIDLGEIFDSKQKILGEKVKKIKYVIKQYAEKNNIRKLNGNNAEAKITSKRSIHIKPLEYLKLLKKLGKFNLFNDTIKVTVSEAKKYVATDDLIKISNITDVEYNSVVLKKK